MIEFVFDNIDVGFVFAEPLDGRPRMSVCLAHEVSVVAFVDDDVAARLTIVDVRRNWTKLKTNKCRTMIMNTRYAKMNYFFPI